MKKKDRKWMVLYVGNTKNMLQLRTDRDFRFSDSDGLLFSPTSSQHGFTFDQVTVGDDEVLSHVHPVGLSILKYVIKRNEGFRHEISKIDRVLIVSAWQMNIYRRHSSIDDEFTSIFISAFEKAFGRRVKQITEPRQLGAVML